MTFLMDNITEQIFSPNIMDLHFSTKPVTRPSNSGLRHLDPETDFKVRRIVAQVNETAHIAANEPSMGLYRIQEHVHRTMPHLVQRKTELKTNLTNVEDAIYDLNLTVEVIDSISHIPHFTRIHEALKTAIDTKRKLNIREERERARVQFDFKNAERANRSLSQNEPAEGYICPICLFALTSQDGLIKHWQENHNIETFEDDCIDEQATLPEVTGKAEGATYIVKQENDMAVIDIENKPRCVSECEDVVRSFIDEEEIVLNEVNEDTASTASSEILKLVDQGTGANNETDVFRNSNSNSQSSNANADNGVKTEASFSIQREIISTSGEDIVLESQASSSVDNTESSESGTNSKDFCNNENVSVADGKEEFSTTEADLPADLTNLNQDSSTNYEPGAALSQTDSPSSIQNTRKTNVSEEDPHT